MNKSELISAIAEKAQLTKVDAKKAVDAFMQATAEALNKGNKLQLIGLGTFSVAERAARKGHNPRNPKEVINIPARKVVRFSAGAALKKAVNKK